MNRNAYQIAGSRSGRFSAIAQQGLLSLYNPTKDVELSAWYKTRDGYDLMDEQGGVSANILPTLLETTDSDSYIYFKDNGSLDIDNGNYTAFGWIKVIGVTRYGNIIGKATNGSEGQWAIQTGPTNTLRFLVITSTDIYSVETDVLTESLTEFTFLMGEVDYDNSKIRFYINNVLEGETDITGTISKPSTDFSTTICCNNNTDGSDFIYVTYAKLYNFGIAKRLLTQTEKDNLFAKGTISNVTAFYPLLTFDAAEQIQHDISGNNYHMNMGSFDDTPKDLFFTNEVGNGSLSLLDNGYTIYESDNVQYVVPNTVDGNSVPSSGALIRKIQGNATRHNLGKSNILFTDDFFDKSDNTIYQDWVRDSIFYNSASPKEWNINEFNREWIISKLLTAHENKLYPKIISNSYSNRLYNLEVLQMSANKSSEDDRKVLTYTKDSALKTKTRAGVCLSFDDSSRIESWMYASRYLYNKYQWRVTFAIDRNTFSPLKRSVVELLKQGHEISNHSSTHNLWYDYLQTHTDQELYDSEIAPQQSKISADLGVFPATVCMWQQPEYVQSFFDLVLANGYRVVRTHFASTNGIPANLSDACYFGISQAPRAINMSVENFPDTAEGDALLLSMLQYALDNDKVIMLFQHTIGTENLSQTISLDRLEMICSFIKNKNMTFYGLSELVPSLFGL